MINYVRRLLSGGSLGRKTFVTPARNRGEALPTRADPALLKALARVFRYQR